MDRKHPLRLPKPDLGSAAEIARWIDVAFTAAYSGGEKDAIPIFSKMITSKRRSLKDAVKENDIKGLKHTYNDFRKEIRLYDPETQKDVQRALVEKFGCTR